MKTPTHAPNVQGAQSAEPLDAALSRQLERIETEDTPENLLKLARELQMLLRDKT